MPKRRAGSSPVPGTKIPSHFENRYLAQKASLPHCRWSCVFQLFKFGLNFRPLFWLSLDRIRRIRMPKEFQ